MSKTSAQGKFAGQPAIRTICLLSFQKAGTFFFCFSGGCKYTPSGCVAEIHERPNCSGRAFIHDTSIAAVVRVLGWLGMLGVVV